MERFDIIVAGTCSGMAASHWQDNDQRGVPWWSRVQTLTPITEAVKEGEFRYSQPFQCGLLHCGVVGWSTEHTTAGKVQVHTNLCARYIHTLAAAIGLSVRCPTPDICECLESGVCFLYLLTYSIFSLTTRHLTPHLSLLISHPQLLNSSIPLPQLPPGYATTTPETCIALHIYKTTASLFSLPICSHAGHPEIKGYLDLHTTALPVPTTTALCR